MSEYSLRGLYAIADTGLLPADSLLEQARAVLQGGARILQYRDKRSPYARQRQQAAALSRLCHEFDCLFIVNDDADLAAAVQADGVHLGRDDCGIAPARARLGHQAIIGLSCYNSLERAILAEQQGADYVAFGRFFPSRTKPEALQAQPELLQQARKALNIPIVAIGGITPDNGALLLRSGADMLAAIHGLFGQPNPTVAARAYGELCRRTSACANE